jgi:putative spermidine/putrescine transport system substrate-binding protein
MRKSAILAAILGVFAILGAHASGKSETSARYDFGTGPVPVSRLAELSAKEGTPFVTYGIPENWAGYKELFAAFNRKYGKEHFDTDLSSGEEIAKMKAEKGNPQADAGDIGITWGPRAISEGVAAAYKHSHWDDIPASYKDPNGAWCAWYTGTFMVMVNEDLVPRVPATWEDLLDPIYKGKVTIGDPRTAAMYFAAFWAANLAMGGSETNITPGIAYFRKLREIGNMNMINPSKASFAKGEVPIYFGWDYLFLNWARELRDESRMKIATFIPADGSVSFPYVYMINTAAPHPATARLWVEFMFSDEAQIINAKYFARPARQSVKLPAEVEALYPPKEAYRSVKPFDWIKADAVKEEFIKRWTNEVLGE